MPKLRRLKTLTLIQGVLALAIAQSTAQADPAVKIKSEGKIQYLKSEREEAIVVDQSYPVNEPFLILAREKLPILVLSAADTQTTEIKPPDYRQLLPKIYKAQVNQALDDILLEVSVIQKLIREGQADEALRHIDTLQTTTPDLAYLKFLRASVQVLRNQRAEAQRLTEEALKAYPNFEEGKLFLDQLKGPTATRKSP